LKTFRYITLGLIAFTIGACQEADIVNPELSNSDNNNNSNVAKVEIWDTDITTGKRSVLLEETLYDRSGRILKNLVYDNVSGDINKEALFTYENGQFIEVQKVMSPEGNLQEIKNEYSYNENGKVESIRSFELSGELIRSEDFVYDEKGNVTNTTLIENNEVQSIDFTYEYNPQGQIEQKMLVQNNRVIRRDSLYRDSQNSLLKIYSFNMDEKSYYHSIIYKYNNRGDITVEIGSGPSNEIKYRRLYYYLYHR
jgi:hypothetical protein